MMNKLEKETILLLKDNKEPLIQTLRRRGEGWIVPNKIETITKYIIKNFQNIHNEEATLDGKKFHVTRDEDDFTVLEHTTKEIHKISIKRKKLVTKHGPYRNINYQGKEYQEPNLSGNTYNHIMSQAEKIKYRTKIDNEKGILSKQEKQEIIIRNYFHDIPEIEKGDIIASVKTIKDREEEDNMAYKIINKQKRPEQEKEKVKRMMSIFNEKSIFKLYEIMFYIFDMIEMIKNKEKHNNSVHLSGAIIGFNFHKFTKNYILPNGNTIYGLNIPSCKQHLKDNIEIIENVFLQVEKSKIGEKRKKAYKEGKQIRKDTIKPHLLNK